MRAMKQRKKYGIVCLFVVLCILTAACKKEEKAPGVPIQEAWTLYLPENVQSYTIDKAGNLYLFDLIISEDSVTSTELKLEKYDKEGSLVFSRLFGKNEFSMITAMTEKDDVLYFTSDGFDEEGMCTVLYAYYPETEELTMLEQLRYFSHVKRIVVNEHCIYVLGNNQISYSSSSLEYVYHGEKVMGYDVETKEVFELGMAEPIDIALDENGNLVLYAHMEDSFCLLNYDEERDTAKVLAKTDVYKMNRIALCNEGKSVLYYSTNADLVMSDLSELEIESELYPGASFWDTGLCYKNGRVACMTKDRKLVQFSLDEVKKENQTVRYIFTGYEPETPYGCGYGIRRTELDEDKFALKILAMDKDFDLCLVDTSDSVSYNLKENGVFYPLNDVPGVQEYLDACFPYVREAATDEDGDIWMLPIAVNLPRFAVNEKKLKEQTLFFDSDMTYEDFFRLHMSLPEEERKLIWIPELAFYSDFIRQYFTYYTSADTAEFRETVALFAKYWACIAESDSSASEQPLYFYSNRENGIFAQYVASVGENVRVYETPKVSAEEQNVGTCLFLAVNPYSDNLDATLNYISDWIAYTMKREDAPLFFANRTVDDTVYETSLYELYQKGEIGFTLDEDIYEGYDEVLENITKLEDYIAETERKLKIYLNE